MDYIGPKDEIPEYLIFAQKSTVARHIVGKAGNPGLEEGWGARYIRHSQVICMGNSDADAIKQKDCDPERVRRDKINSPSVIEAEGAQPIAGTSTRLTLLIRTPLLCVEGGDSEEREADRALRKTKNQRVGDVGAKQMGDVFFTHANSGI